MNFLRLLPLFLLGCAATDHRTVALPNGCHVNAVAFRNSLKAKNALREAKVLIVSWAGHPVRHAYCAYESGGRVYVYDNRNGSWELSRNLALLTDGNKLAKSIDVYSTGYFE